MELFKLFGKIAIDNTEANRAIDDTTQKAGDSEKKQKKSFEGIGKAAATLGKGVLGAGVAMGAAFIASVEGTREYRKEMGLLESSFLTAGHSSETAKNVYSELNAVMGDTGAAVEASQHLAKITDSEKELQTWTDICTGVYSEFGSAIPIESLTESALEVQKNGQLTGGLVDALVWAGISEEEFQAQLDACTSEQERQDLIMNTLNDTYKKASDQYKETNKDVLEAEKAQERLTDAFARLGGMLEPVMTVIKNSLATAIDYVLDFVESFDSTSSGWDSLWSTVKEVWTTYGQPIFESIKEILKLVFDEFVNTILPSLQALWQTAWNNIQIAWESIGKPIFAFVSDAARQLVDLFKQYFPQISQAVKEAFDIVNRLWKEVLQPVLKIVGDYVQNTLLPRWKFAFDTIMKVVKVVFDGIIALWNKSLKPILNGIIDFVSGVLTGNWSKAWNGIKSIISGVWEGIKTVVSTGLGVVKSVFSSILDTLGGIASKAFGKVKDSISEKIEAAKGVVEKAVNKIKDFFNIDLKFKAIKMPKISIAWEKGSGVLAKAAELLDIPGVPKFSVKWNALGGILKEPSIFGFDPKSMQFLGGGEAGNEAIAPIDTLQTYVQEAVRSENKAVLYYMRQIVQMLAENLPTMANSQPQIVLDGNTLVGKLAPRIDQELGALANRKKRGNT